MAVAAADYIKAANVVDVTRMCQMASAIAVLYDHAITIDREVDHVWVNPPTHPCSFGSIIYLLIRYIGDGLSILNILAFLGPGVQTQNSSSNFVDSEFMDSPNSPVLHSCNVYFFVQSWLSILVLFLIQLMLQVRLYALFQRSRIILALMVSGYLCEIAALAVIMIFLGTDARIRNEIRRGLYICADTNGPSFFHQYIVWLPLIVYDGLLCLLALWHCVSHWISGYYRAKRVYGVYITDALIKGNAAYFFCIVLACVISVVIGHYLGSEWIEVSQGYPVTVEAVVGCRLMLNLRLLLEQETETECGDISEDAPWDALVHPLSTLLT